MQIPLGILVAKLLLSLGRRAVWGLVLCALPLVVPWNMIPMLWLGMIQPQTGLFGFVAAWGFDYKFNPVHTWILILMVDTWHWLGLVAILAYAGFASVPQAYRQAASIDGASGWAVFRHIEMPRITGALAIVLLLRCVDSLMIYTEAFTINAGGPVGDSRLGAADYSDVTWWLEWYTATGATVVTATVAVTYNDGTTGNLTAQSLAATRPASHMISLNALIPAAAAGKYIRGVTSVTLSATTATAGSFGVTATRVRSAIGAPIANYKVTADWAQLGLPQVANGACLFPIVLTSTTSSGTVRGGGKIIHG